MDLFTKITDLFFSEENRKMAYEERMDRLRDLIANNNNRQFENGVLQGMLNIKDEIDKLTRDYFTNKQL